MTVRTLTPAAAYAIAPARYAKGKMVIRPVADGSGYKTRAARLASTFGKWVNRSGGYTVSAAAARRFERLYYEGYDASVITGELQPPLSSEARS